MSKTIGLFAGSFDPFHLGHQSIAVRASGLVDELIVAIGIHPTKEVLYSTQDRKVMIERALKECLNVVVMDYAGPLVDFAQIIEGENEEDSRLVLIRGLRNASDFQYEAQFAYANKSMNEDQQFETIFIMTDPEFGLVSSTLVREAIFHRKDCTNFLPKAVFDIVMFRDDHPASCLVDKESKVLGS